MDPPQAEASQERTLVLAPIGRDSSACVEVLHRVRLAATVCVDLPQLQQQLEAGAAAVIVAEEGLIGKDLDMLFRWVAGQPPWSDLPFLVLTGTVSNPRIASWRSELIANLRNVSLIERPIQALTLTSAVQAALRARSRQYQVRALLEARDRNAAELESLVQARTRQLELANAALRSQIVERARVEESLRQAQKMEAIGQLTGGIAHDFNNLLMVITAGLDMLGRAADPRRRELLMNGMLQAAERGSGLTRQLLAFSRQQPLQSRPVDLARLIERMRPLLDRSLSASVQMGYAFSHDLWPVNVDAGELELAVLNLAVNARDAMPCGGTITVRARNLMLDNEQLKGQFVNLEIIDAGVGMSPEVKAHVFEPYFTTKEVGKGSGLGLAQVYGFARQSGGSVEIQSEVGQGTTVSLLLPRSVEAPEAEADTVSRTGTHRVLRGSVLLVEDDDEVSALVRELLAELGFEATRVATAKAALGALADGRPIDLVFSDIMMPGDMDGLGLAREIRQRRPDLPVLLTSGYAQRAIDETELGGLRILRKPYRIEELAEALEGVLGLR